MGPNGKLGDLCECVLVKEILTLVHFVQLNLDRFLSVTELDELCLIKSLGLLHLLEALFRINTNLKFVKALKGLNVVF